MPETLKEEWPGTGCAAGRTASVKVGARLDLLSGELYVPPMRAGREHDRTLALEAEAMPEAMPESALRLADLLGASSIFWGSSPASAPKAATTG